MIFKQIEVTNILPKKSGVTQTGKHKGKPWTLWIVTDKEEKEYTTFEDRFKMGQTYKIQYTEEIDGMFVRRSIQPWGDRTRKSTCDCDKRFKDIEDRLVKLVLRDDILSERITNITHG